MINQVLVALEEENLARARRELSDLQLGLEELRATDPDALTLGRAELEIALAEGSLEGRKRRLEDLRNGWEPAPIEDADETEEPAA